jgi:pimeloyl-ACP methyl ester carboxylesterase
MVDDPDRAERARRSGSAISVAISRFLNLGVKPDKRLQRFVEAMTAQTPAQAVGDFWVHALDSHDKRDALATLGAVPTLVIVGDRDRLTPVHQARAIAAAIPGSALLELRGAGHCAMLEQPDAVNAAIGELAERVAATRSAKKTAKKAAKKASRARSRTAKEQVAS